MCFFTSCGNETGEYDTLNQDASTQDALNQAPFTQNAIEFSREALLYDYDYMWEMLEANFSALRGIQIADYGPQIDWRRVRDAGRIRIETAPNDYFSPSCVKTLLDRTLGEFQYIGHLGVFQQGTYDFIMQLYHDLEDDTLSVPQVFASILSNPQSSVFYENPGNLNNGTIDQFVEMTDEEIHMNLLYPAISNWQEDNIAYLRIATFSFPTYRANQLAIELLNEILSKNKDVDHLIIDVRGNGGGSISVWLEGIVFPLRSESTYVNRVGAVLDGDHNRFLWEEKLSADWYEFFPIADGHWQNYFPYINPLYVENMDYIVSFRSEWVDSSPYERAAFEGDIWLLIDGWGFSATDGFVNFAKYNEFATLVGTRTNGSGGSVFGTQFIFTLPRTGVAIQYEIDMTFNIDGTINQIIGTQPHIEIAEGEDALDFVLETIFIQRGFAFVKNGFNFYRSEAPL